MINNKRIFYKDIDRILRIVYRDLSMSDHLDFINDSSVRVDDSNFSEEKCFDLANNNLRKRIKITYVRAYPDNYNEEELESLLDFLSEKIKKHYNSTDSYYLIHLVSSHIINQSNDDLYINFDDLLEWDGLINKIEDKFFTVSYLSQNNIPINQKHFYPVKRHNNKQVLSVCQREGLSENHMHLKASGYLYEINWYHFLQTKLTDISKYRDFIALEGVYDDAVKTKGRKEKILQRILKLKVIRMALVSLRQNSDSLHLTKRMIFGILASDDVELYLMAIGKLNELDTYNNDLSVEEQNLKDKYGTYGFAAVELQFLKETMDYLKQDNQEKNYYFYRYLLNLYICGVNELKFHFVQDNYAMGFSKFKKVEDNKNGFIPEITGDNSVKESVFHKYYREHVVRKIEFRVTPEKKVNDYIKLITELDQLNEDAFNQYKSDYPNRKDEAKKIKYGIIIHFIKMLKNPSESFVEDRRKKRERVMQQADTLIEALDDIDRRSDDPKDNQNLKNKIIGIDTANYEVDNRPDLYACLFRKVRRGTSRGRVLGATYHVGEEFITLANGLRAIDEVITFCDYRENDRFGHALALGVDPDDYFLAKRDNIFCSIGDYLDDLVWLYLIISSSADFEDHQNLAFLEDEFAKYKHLLFPSTSSYQEFVTRDASSDGKTLADFDLAVYSNHYNYDMNITFDDYKYAYVLRGDCPDTHLDVFSEDDYNSVIQRYDYQFNVTHPLHETAFRNKKARRLFLRYSFDNCYIERSNKSFRAELSDQYIGCVKKAQRLLKEKVISKTIFVESNPTSNKKISYVKKYCEIAGMNLNKHILEDEDANLNVPISINTDDSNLFQTNLSNEYSLVAAALIREGYTRDKVYDYLEYLARNSNSHSFVED